MRFFLNEASKRKPYIIRKYLYSKELLLIIITIIMLLLKIGATKSEGPVGRDKQITGILSNNRDDTRSDYLNSITENNLNILDNSRSQNGKQTMDNDTIDPAVDEFLNELHMDKAVTSTKNASVSSNALNRANQYARSAKDPTNNKEPLYGKYYCDQCTATWGSAKTIIPQTCLKCGNVVYPHTLVS